MKLLFALISETTLITPKELYAIRPYLERNAAHCAFDWGIDEPTVEVFDRDSNLPDFCAPLVFVSDDSDPGVLATHRWNYGRAMPAGRVYTQRATGLFIGPNSLLEAAGHEIVETMVDPRCDLWTSLPGRPGVQVAYEIGDPVQDTYDLGLGDGVQGANYVKWSYFDNRLVDPEQLLLFLKAGGRFDRKGTLVAPGSIGGEGYLILRDNTRHWTEDVTGGAASRSKPGALHPMSRTERRLAEAA